MISVNKPNQKRKPYRKGFKCSMYLGLIQSQVAEKIFEALDLVGNKVWKCSVCEFARKKKSVVVNHVEYKHLDSRVVCEVCQLTFSHLQSLRKHIKTQHEAY